MWKFMPVGVMMFGLSSVLAAGELNVQGSSATGGDAGTIRGRVNGDTAFSVTGRFNDQVVFYDVFGNEIHKTTIRALANGNPGPFTRPRAATQLPDGQTRVWLNLSWTEWWLDGGAVGVWNGSWLDVDPIELN